uniref:Uncharacterized protein n=1 Tax=Heterorhabditis bacteriophora TaxID=37862 RepID=A0A1I7WFM7_HETBA
METPFGSRMEPILRCKPHFVRPTPQGHHRTCRINTKAIVTIDGSLSVLMCPRCNLLPVIMSFTVGTLSQTTSNRNLNNTKSSFGARSY